MPQPSIDPVAAKTAIPPTPSTTWRRVIAFDVDGAAARVPSPLRSIVRAAA